MANLSTEFRVGIFTLLGIAATVFALLVVSPDFLKRENRVEYYTIVEDASGIMSKTHVKTNGVSIGKVASVELQTNSTRLVLSVDRAVKIPKGSTIEIRTVGFLGDKFIEIKRTDAKEFMAPGDFIPRNPDAADLSTLIADASKIAKDIKKVTGALADAVGEEHNNGAIHEMVDNIRVITRDVREILASNKTSFGHSMVNIEKFTTSLNEIVSEDNKRKFDRILTAFDDSMVEVKSATKNINLISTKIQKGEGTIGRLINDEKTVEEVDGALKDIRDVLTPVSALQVAVDYHGEYRRDKTTQNYFDVQFKTRPGNYYLIGFTDVNQEEQTQTIQTFTPVTNGTGTSSTTKTTTKDRKALRFDLQIARRWYFAGVRFGLFESTGGLAGDIYAFSDRLRLSLEAFDFADQNSEIRRTAHLKAYASVLFFDHVYTMMGINDPTKIDPNTGQVTKTLNYFVGAGVNFNDQDLKALFGVAALASPK